ncbi:hypothetical protein [Bradyrhizobium sp. CCBAU 53380]|uniref:hypothetical protein n=1 Tax=Bradyrhizobium sp. CCBAU 53380 TaxID=1325117 RepID=UPI0023026344|nr:hypothetical protein [Bradyrhizobium sp. CCBAU 53380]MDA9424027.1 hypothetical protein [Bradyrhizobium sp. CCBAU 53380]
MANVYTLKTDPVNDEVEFVETRPIAGSYLSYNRHDAIGRAFLAADLHLGLRTLREPTIVQAAYLARVNRTYAFWAVKRFPNRAEIEAGLLPLVPPAKPKLSIITSDTVSDLELAEMIRKVGVEHTFEVMMAVEAAE